LRLKAALTQTGHTTGMRGQPFRLNEKVFSRLLPPCGAMCY